jgi:GH15 family glucan-1,4-alpha-glucosidase
LEPVELSAVRGYADSRPVRFGNRAAKQRQLGSLAFFADCARIYVESDGSLRDKHWQLLRRTANYTCTHWHLPESGIWELSVEAHYVAGKVMSWVVLERAAQISRLTGFGEDEELVRATIRRPKMGASHPRSSPLLCGDSLSGSFSRLLLALNSAGK